MLVDAETACKLREMGADDLVEALRAQDGMCAGLTFSKRIKAAADEAHPSFIDQKVRNLTLRAGLRYPAGRLRRGERAARRARLDAGADRASAQCLCQRLTEHLALEGFSNTN